MYGFTFAFAIGWAFMKMMKASEAYKAETGADMLGSDKFGQFIKSFFSVLIVLWIIETALYMFILFGMPIQNLPT